MVMNPVDRIQTVWIRILPDPDILGSYRILKKHRISGWIWIQIRCTSRFYEITPGEQYDGAMQVAPSLVPGAWPQHWKFCDIHIPRFTTILQTFPHFWLPHFTFANKFANFYTHGPGSKFAIFVIKTFVRHCRPIKFKGKFQKTEVPHRGVTPVHGVGTLYANANGELSAMRLLSDCVHFAAYYRRG